MVAAKTTPDKTRLAEGQGNGRQMSKCRRLNYREKRFCMLVAQGMAKRRAYMAISGVKNEDSASAVAYRWSIRPAVEAQIAKLRAEMTEEGALSRAEKRHALANVVRSEEDDTRDKLTAIQIDNRMTGDDDPFRKAAGEDLRVQFFVVRVGESEANAMGRDALPLPNADEPGQLADGGADNAINVTASAVQTSQAQPDQSPSPSPQ